MRDRTAIPGHIHISQDMSEGEILQSLNQTRDAIVAAGGNAPKGVRPPGGKINDASKAVLAKAGMPSIIWSVDTLDWKTRNAQHTIDTVLRQVQGRRYHPDA